ncbi:MAG: PAS domain S-box protein [Micavibrio aeruginosavorus]|uniref:histidine kinase n=1 Tax=Micavibrio aeruginosavorus TaxID=349221 RepID=A0A7T5UH28_9BACT|nr:MAG: PAS domain S-box protein [Micavibrio aeruginosavorus]
MLAVYKLTQDVHQETRADVNHQQLFEMMPVPRFIIKVRGRNDFVIAEVNQKALTYFNKNREDVLGHPLGVLLSSTDTRYFLESLDAAVRQKRPVTVKALAGANSGPRLGNFYINPLPGSDGAVSIVDVLALPSAGDSQSLQRERDDAISLLTSVFDVSEVGIVVTDQNQRIVRVNDSFVRIYGWHRDDLIGHEFANLLVPEEQDLARSNHDDFINSGTRSSGEMKIVRKDGNVANALFTTAALELSNGRRFQVTTIMDITLRKQMEITLRLAKEQADTANQAKSTFLANMSHELRTPLNAIIGFSEMMIKETFGPLANEKYKEYLGDIHLSARHLLEIINEVLDMSKIEAGRAQLDEELFDVSQMVSAVSRMMASRAFSAGLKIVEEIDPDIPPLYADPRLVRQILINLVGNAVKYSNEGGTIGIRAYMTKYRALHIVVSDEGIGIPKDRISEALEPFGQVSRPSDSRGGTGLGLPLAKAMTELHGGALSLESDLGKGTVVTVEFPEDRLNRQKKTGEVRDPMQALVGKAGTV